MTGERTLTIQQRPLRWSEMRDEHAPLLETIDSFLVHRHDLSDATATNYRLAITTFAKWAQEQLERPAEVGDLEPGTVEAFLSHRRTTASAQCARSAWVALRSLAAILRGAPDPPRERRVDSAARPHAEGQRRSTPSAHRQGDVAPHRARIRRRARTPRFGAYLDDAWVRPPPRRARQPSPRGRRRRRTPAARSSGHEQVHPSSRCHDPDRDAQGAR